MPKLRVHNLAMTLDGYLAGPDQSVDHPIGVGGNRLHDWAFGDRTPVADDFFDRGTAGIGATIMGRNMFGPVRGPWPDETWRGWWGEEPPFHHPVFVLTRHPRPSFTMDGGTTFHFVTEGIEAALAAAIEAAGGDDVRLGGGASTVQEYLRAGLVDSLHLAVVPHFLGAGERLFDNLDGGPHGFECVELVTSPRVTHVCLERTA